MLGIGKFKELALQVIDYAIVELSPAWRPEDGPINEYLGRGVTPALAAAVRGFVEEKKGVLVPVSMLEGYMAEVGQKLPEQIPANADPLRMAAIAAAGAEAFRSEYPEGSGIRTLVDEALAGTPAAD